MKYSETGFREFYKHFVAIPVSDRTKSYLEGFPGYEEANYIVAYGYYDRESGLNLEVLCAARFFDNKVQYAAGNESVSSTIRINNIADDECYLINDNGELTRDHKKKLDMLSSYDVSEEIESTRSLPFLDASRDKVFIDDVMVQLYKDGLETEKCLTRITGRGKHGLIGMLLEEPKQNFGWHKGETIVFFVKEEEDKSVTCFTDMNPSKRITAKDLEDGSMLKEAVEKFQADRNEANFLDILEILRDSYVWIPCYAVLSEEDQKRIQKMCDETGEDLNDLIGKEFTNADAVRFIPDILQHGDEYYFPIFSTAEEMGEYGNHFSKLQRHFLEALTLATNNEKNVSGIVLNAFSTPFILDRQIFDVFKNMKSRIELSES